MEKFLKQLIRFSIIPVIAFSILLVSYLYYDPFQVVKKYKSFYVSGKPRYVTLNYDYVAVETFLNNYPTYKYNSFIIGSSRSRFYQMDTWSKYIHSNKCFHFDASGETIYGITKKMELLNAKKVQIANVLIVLDYLTLTGVHNSKGHLYIKHPLLSGQNLSAFQLQFFKTYCSLNFLYAYLDFKLSGRFKPYMKTKGLLDDVPVDYDLKYNEMKLSEFDNLIESDPTKYYNEKRMAEFYRQDSIKTFSPVAIREEQATMLNKIASIFKKNSTSFKIVINPLYDQNQLNKKDVNVLNQIFGEENVFDFSGINSITSDYHNYYEPSHYRPSVASKIMKQVYQR